MAATSSNEQQQQQLDWVIYSSPFTNGPSSFSLDTIPLSDPRRRYVYILLVAWQLASSGPTPAIAGTKEKVVTPAWRLELSARDRSITLLVNNDCHAFRVRADKMWANRGGASARC